ncbi:DUF4176 domain-containing protein [Salipaludibacillus sp. LMS25]|jgi:hypothetical protein|uniref:DUF4176 domain-containing protein n=1 Tax=Salipaludibacillus sp. LMS25 TaxID=2924031 RepID=UPI0020D1DFDD|nr:DUF4176 domain-containing protein [Salipaludibacillus sp. LMS25]UTR14859.1 DUF4176 domain-containing protein [Salipaludibacillus sp. LMS25]
MMTINRDFQLKTLLTDVIEQMVHPLEQAGSDDGKGILLALQDVFISDPQLVTQLYQAYRQSVGSLTLSHHGDNLVYEREGDDHTIRFKQAWVSFNNEHYASYLAVTLEMVREVLPLGSVVELDPLYFKPSEKTDSPTLLVITGRFIAPKGYTTYFPYKGVVYPVGEVKANAHVHFTTPLIKKVIQRGYKDESELAFELMMKKELILDRGMTSLEFSPKAMTQLQTELTKN